MNLLLCQRTELLKSVLFSSVGVTHARVIIVRCLSLRMLLPLPDHFTSTVQAWVYRVDMKAIETSLAFCHYVADIFSALLAF